MKPPKPYIPTAVREMSEEERPRERLEHTCAESLRDAEPLAILFRTSTRTKGAVALAEELLSHFDGLRKLSRASLEDLQQVKAIGKVKAIEIKSALELGKRLANLTEKSRTRIESAKNVADLLMLRYKDNETEVFKCLLLNTKNDVLKVLDISLGGLDGTMADPKDVFRQAVREGATGVVACHNHPSGDPKPSPEDIAVTKRLLEAGDVLGIRVLGHVIFGDGTYTSLKERNLM
ncbi:MAG: DNA repair protein RadC [Candidatus Hydrogenedentota bacterium]